MLRRAIIAMLASAAGMLAQHKPKVEVEVEVKPAEDHVFEAACVQPGRAYFSFATDGACGWGSMSGIDARIDGKLYRIEAADIARELAGYEVKE